MTLQDIEKTTVRSNPGHYELDLQTYLLHSKL